MASCKIFLLLVSVVGFTILEVSSVPSIDFQNLTSLLPDSGSKFRCDYTYSEKAQGWLKLHKHPAKWPAALQTCQNEGASLATIFTEAVKLAMIEMIKNATVESVVTAEIEVPTDSESSCKLLSSDGKETAFVTDTANLFICFHAGLSSVTLNECGTTDNDYKLNKHTNTCHKFHTLPRDWKTAKTVCEAEGGNLVVINDEEEAKGLKILMGDKTALVGIAANKKKEFLTVQNKSLSSVYNKYASDQPKPDGNDLCGAIDTNQLLTTVNCDTAYNFICEKDTKRPCDHENIISKMDKIRDTITEEIKSVFNSSPTAFAVVGLIRMLFMSLICFIAL